jgi:CRISPR-associated protein Cas5h
LLAFEIWGKFASFRDPFTISQNLTFNLPPKTTIGGMMASFLGLPNETKENDIAYFDEKDFFDFHYSCIIKNPIFKKTFSQNYINDYTKSSATKLDVLLKGQNKDFKVSPKPINRELLLNPKYLIIIDNFK